MYVSVWTQCTFPPFSLSAHVLTKRAALEALTACLQSESAVLVWLGVDPVLIPPFSQPTYCESMPLFYSCGASS